jgi:Bax protein
MDIKRLMLAGFLLIVVLLGINFWPPSAPPEAVPDFAAYARVAEKKQAFFDFVRPSIQIENSLILAERQALLAIKASVAAEARYADFEVEQIRQLAEKYRVPNREALSDNEVLTNLLSRVDVVPEGLALAQAANESAWGTSRFARDYRNFFGLWCFTEGCGVKPRQASAESTHQVAAFDSGSCWGCLLFTDAEFAPGVRRASGASAGSSSRGPGGYGRRPGGGLVAIF